MEFKKSYYHLLLENDPNKSKYYDWIKYELDNRIYYYGDHFKCPFEKNQKTNLLFNIISKTKEIIIRFKLKERSDVKYKDQILSEAYFSIGDFICAETGIKVSRFPWNLQLGNFSHKRIKKIINKIHTASYNDFLSDEFYNDIYFLYEQIKRFLTKNNIKFLIFPNDMTALNRIAIDACKEIGIPTVIYLHGLPARYNNIDDNRANFLCVWGEGIKKQYEKVGFDSKKIIVTGHPIYSNIKFKYPQNIDFNAPLVLSYPICGAPSISDRYIIGDRGICINYPWNVETVLKKIGVKKAIFRVHPSENIMWYKQYIDNEFYTLDTENLQDSLSKSTIVIGPTTTVAMDAAIKRIPFFCFEPIMNNTYPLVPPFDGSEPEFPIAKNNKELEFNLMNNRHMQPSVFQKYIASEFNIKLLLEKLKYE